MYYRKILLMVGWRVKPCVSVSYISMIQFLMSLYMLESLISLHMKAFGKLI